MKILIESDLRKVRQLAAAAALLLEEAGRITWKAWRMHGVHRDLERAMRDVKRVARDLDQDWFKPLCTPKTMRMERMERQREEKRMKRVTMGGSSKGQGPGGQLPSGGCRTGEKEPKR